MSSSGRVRVTEVSAGQVRHREDRLAVEAPLEIRISTTDGPMPLAVTMRTPSDDLELAAGFLLSEGVIRSAADVVTLRHCRQVPQDRRANTVLAQLAGAPTVAAAALAARGVTAVRPTPVDPSLLLALPDRLRAAQPTFERTGGLHAAGLFSPAGELLCVREDVGRHNALDKVIGWALLQDLLPVHGHTIVVSGRTSFELVQKSVVAGAGALAGVSAPSTLAVQLAREFGLALAGFVRGERFVLYAGVLTAEPVGLPL